MKLPSHNYQRELLQPHVLRVLSCYVILHRFKSTPVALM